ncbi:MAG: helix-turn-helix transcriptional regulator [Alphaproteobacteria bacterium]|nr:helix-turn-helix transcriptional regulator [Alphaproteobacteria bacterium]
MKKILAEHLDDDWILPSLRSLLIEFTRRAKTVEVSLNWKDTELGVTANFKLPGNGPTASDGSESIAWRRPPLKLFDLVPHPLEQIVVDDRICGYRIRGGSKSDFTVQLVLNLAGATASDVQSATDFCQEYAESIALVLSQSAQHWRLHCMQLRFAEALVAEHCTRVLVDRDGRVCFDAITRNAKPQYLEKFFFVRNGELRCRVPRDTPVFREAIASCLQSGSSLVFRPSASDHDLERYSIIIRPHGRQRARAEAGNLRFKRLAELIFSDVGQSRVTAQHLRDLLGLTPVESEIAATLVSGSTPAYYASRMGVKISTVRWHVRNIFRRTDCKSQTEFVALVLRRLCQV